MDDHSTTNRIAMVVGILVVAGVFAWWTLSLFKAPADMPSSGSRTASGMLPRERVASGLFEAERPQAAPREEAREAGDSESLVRLKDLSDRGRLEGLVAAAGGRITGFIPELGVFRIAWPDGVDPEVALGDLPVAFNESNPSMSIPGEPNADDPLLANGAARRTFGPDYLEWLGVDGDASGWGRGITVAVIDTGVQMLDVFSAGQVRALDGGITDQMSGAEILHGTLMAALVGGADGVGVAPAASILDVSALGVDGVGDAFGVAQAIIAAVQAGARVLNLSVGTYSDSSVVRDAVLYAQNAGALVVASAGNDGLSRLSYPAAYPGVVSVGAIDPSAMQAEFSNAGEGLALMAPGQGLTIRVDATGNAVSTSGTSPATGLVSGAAAALWSAYPQYSATQVATLLGQSASDSGPPGYDASYGSGYLDVERLMHHATPGRTDLAVAGISSAASATSTEKVIITVGAQNRGTTPVTGARLKVETSTGIREAVLPMLQAGQTGSVAVPVGRSEVAALGGIVVTATVSMPGASDLKPSNDSVRWVLSVPATP